MSCEDYCPEIHNMDEEDFEKYIIASDPEHFYICISIDNGKQLLKRPNKKSYGTI
tara:strand:- start:129 stop:293 length:165 start_codon:yes stop_codon:yes gene_type:complete